jgi:uncharacterized membrane protein YeaQ/YmgE (transglycosylase-associated protein family)
MDLIVMFVIGLLAGIVAKFVMPGKGPGGIIATALLGIAGSFVATFLGKYVGWYQGGSLYGGLYGFIGAVLGAIVLLVIYNLFFTRRR